MNPKITLALFCLLISFNSFSQDPIDVTDQTLKIGGTKSEEILLGFAAGDKIIFNFSEVNDKDLKEIEIIEYPNTSKFSDFKTSKIENKTLTVLSQSVYIFRFKNSSLGGRICKIRIQRIPATEETKNFNTAVSWVIRQDTSWSTYTKDIVIGYDTVYQQKLKKEVIKTEQREELLLDKTERVGAGTSHDKKSVFFTLPANSSIDNKTSKVIAWAYWVGVGEDANKAWQANTKAAKSVIKAGAAYFTTPLGALAIGLVADLIIPKMGEDVHYTIPTTQQGRDLFLAGKGGYRIYDEGKGIVGYKKFTSPALCQGIYFICLYNDNLFQSIDATVKVVAIVETTEYEDKAYTDIVVTPKYEKQLFKEPSIKSYKTAITGL